jgi:chromosome segregation ATPase
MNRFLHWFNLAGVLALALLCVLQWRMNRQLNLDLNAAAKARQQQAARLDDQEKRLKGGASDLDGFREQLTRATASLKETELKLAALDRQVKQLTNERDQLKTSVTNWAAAVTARDTQLRQAGADLKKLADDRNAAVLKFNEVATKQNDLVKELERRTKEHNAVVETLNQRTREFNALVEKYNTLAKQAAPKPTP